MALRNAAEVYDRLRGMHDSDPRKQKFKAELAGHFQCVVYDADGKPRTVRAENIEHYVGKGFSVSAPAVDVPAEPKKTKRRGGAA